jgi:CBS domain-containing protein
MGVAGLAVTGAAAAGVVWWRRRQRKSTFQRAMDLATEFASEFSPSFGALDSRRARKLASDFASDFAASASDVHPAWWAALAASALPLAYYLRPTSQPSSSEQARSWFEDMARGSSEQADEHLRLLRRFSKETAQPGLAEAKRRAARWASQQPAQLDRLADAAPTINLSELLAAAAEYLPSRDRLPSMSDLPSRSDLPTLSDARRSRLTTYGLPALGMTLAGAIIYLMTRRSGVESTARVADVMTRRPQVIRPEASVAEAAALMKRLDVGALPICDASRLVGMLTDRDIALRLAAEGRDPQLTRVQDIMSERAAWATEDDLVDEAARIMREHRIRRLPIVDERHNLVGIVSLGDLATEVADEHVSGETLRDVSQP